MNAAAYGRGGFPATAFEGKFWFILSSDDPERISVKTETNFRTVKILPLEVVASPIQKLNWLHSPPILPSTPYR